MAPTPPPPPPLQQQPPAWPRPRFGRLGTVLAWVAIALGTAAFMGRDWAARHLLPAAPAAAADPYAGVDLSKVRSAQLEVTGRYAIGATDVIGGLRENAGGPTAAEAAQLGEQV